MSNQPKLLGAIREKFRFSTLNFIFIMIYISVFQSIFGPENSIVGVIFAVLMSASLARDLTATPVRHLITQALVLVWMALAAYWVGVLPIALAAVINFITLLGILYAFTYEYSNHMYFPYILSYLFLIFITPVQESRLPVRLAAMLTGAVSIILYQWFMGRKRIVVTARDVLSSMIDRITDSISGRLSGNAAPADLAAMRHLLCSLSQIVYERRKKILCVSDAGFYMLDAGRGLEHVLLLVNELPETLTPRDHSLLQDISSRLGVFRSFLHGETAKLPVPENREPAVVEDESVNGQLLYILDYIQDRLVHMTDPQNRRQYRPTALSLRVRLQAALDLSPVRAIYALRTALILTAATSLVQAFSLSHGRWLLFTLASVSLPYADDVPLKIRKRVLATLAGGLASVVIYSLIPSAPGRVAAMMLSGYLSFYCTDYVQTFACSTVGALGGAVFMGAYGFHDVGSVFLIRLGYIAAGAMLGYILNCLVLPYNRAKATRRLFGKYRAVTGLLSKVCHSPKADAQLYYNLVIQAHLQEETLARNARLEEWSGFPHILSKCREQVRKAHCTRIDERENALVFEPEHP